MKAEQAKIKLKRTIKIVGHPCKSCEWSHPPVIFEGIVSEGKIEWPIQHGYHISYCPHCGLKLPMNYGKGAS